MLYSLRSYCKPVGDLRSLLPNMHACCTGQPGKSSATRHATKRRNRGQAGSSKSQAASPTLDTARRYWPIITDAAGRCDDDARINYHTPAPCPHQPLQSVHCTRTGVFTGKQNGPRHPDRKVAKFAVSRHRSEYAKKNATNRKYVDWKQWQRWKTYWWMSSSIDNTPRSDPLTWSKVKVTSICIAPIHETSLRRSRSKAD